MSEVKDESGLSSALVDAIRERVQPESREEAKSFLNSMEQMRPATALYMLRKSQAVTELTHGYTNSLRALLALKDRAGADDPSDDFIRELEEITLRIVDTYERLQPFREQFEKAGDTEAVRTTLRLLDNGELLKGSGIGNLIACSLNPEKALGTLRGDVSEEKCLGYCELLMVYSNLLKWTKGEQEKRLRDFLREATLLLVMDPEKFSAAAVLASDRIIIEDAEVEGVGGELLLALANTNPDMGKAAVGYGKFREGLREGMSLAHIRMK